jgi:Ca2+-binding RTX toxin-like protein
MTLSAAEQYLLELINRGRLDPAGEAARMGIDLNAGLAAGTISTAAKQVLAPNALLEQAATAHTLWMLANDIFSHTGVNGSQPSQRATAAGYQWSWMGENIAFTGSTGIVTVEARIAELNANLFHSAGHRTNMMNGSYREIGLGAEAGVFTQSGVNYNAAMLTENFGTSGTAHFLTGVAYADRDHDRFYSMGEGVAGVVFRTSGASTSTAAAGGYSLALASGAATAITGQIGAKSFALTVDMSLGNVKLDLVNGATFYTSGSVVLGAGINNLRLLGVAALNATGNAADNAITGNAGANVLWGGAGQDVLTGNAGADQLHGGAGNDRLLGNAGADRLFGEAGDDMLTGGGGADTFIFGVGGGSDTITDFTLAQGDRLRLDDALWAGQTLTGAGVMAKFAVVGSGEVALDFGGGLQVHLTGLTSMTGLASHIEIF